MKRLRFLTLRAVVFGCLLGARAVHAAEQGDVDRAPVLVRGRPSLPGVAVYSIAIDALSPTTIFVSTASLQIFKSTDGGSHWVLPGAPLLSFPWGAIGLTTDPTAEATVYASFGGCYARFPGSCLGSLYRSEDGGVTWGLLRDGIFGGPVLVDPQRTGTLYARENLEDWDPRFLFTFLVGTAIKSLDSGATWTTLDFPIPTSVNTLAAGRIDLDRIFAGTPDGVFLSQDGGETWALSNEGLTNLQVASIAVGPTADSIVYAATPEGVFRSDDGGVSWIQTSLKTSVAFLVLDPEDSRVIYASDHYKLFRSGDAGETWAVIEPGLPYANVLALNPAGAALYVGTNDGLFEFEIRKTRRPPPRSTVHAPTK
jgi:hypothetical protein